MNLCYYFFEAQRQVTRRCICSYCLPERFTFHQIILQRHHHIPTRPWKSTLSCSSPHPLRISERNSHLWSMAYEKNVTCCVVSLVYTGFYNKRQWLVEKTWMLVPDNPKYTPTRKAQLEVLWLFMQSTFVYTLAFKVITLNTLEVFISSCRPLEWTLQRPDLVSHPLPQNQIMHNGHRA